jgi:hypothetical protein
MHFSKSAELVEAIGMWHFVFVWAIDDVFFEDFGNADVFVSKGVLECAWGPCRRLLPLLFGWRRGLRGSRCRGGVRRE